MTRELGSSAAMPSLRTRYSNPKRRFSTPGSDLHDIERKLWAGNGAWNADSPRSSPNELISSDSPKLGFVGPGSSAKAPPELGHDGPKKTRNLALLCRKTKPIEGEDDCARINLGTSRHGGASGRNRHHGDSSPSGRRLSLTTKGAPGACLSLGFRAAGRIAWPFVQQGHHAHTDP